VTSFMLINMAPLTNEDKILIKTLRTEKGWGAFRLMRKFPSRKWKKSTLYNFIKQIDKTGNTDRKKVAVDCGQREWQQTFKLFGT